MNKIITITQLNEKVEQIKNQLKQETTTNKKEIRIKYLGKKGLFKDLAKVMSSIDPQNKKSAGQILNQLKSLWRMRFSNCLADKKEICQSILFKSQL